MSQPRYPNPDLIIKLYQDGLPIHEICKIGKCCPETVYKYTKRAGLSRTTKIKASIKEMFESGMCRGEICASLGQTRKNLSNTFWNYGIPYEPDRELELRRAKL